MLEVKTERPEKQGKNVKLSNALKRGSIKNRLRALSTEDLAVLLHKLRTTMHWWMGDPTRKSLEELMQRIPELSSLVDFRIVLDRLQLLGNLDRTPFGIKQKTFFPELNHIAELAKKEFTLRPQGVGKTDSWLKGISLDAGADADLEAAIYFASRNKREFIDIESIRGAWYRAVCGSVSQGVSLGKPPESVIERAKNGTISLSEAAEVLGSQGSIPRLFGFYDQEEDFIDATMFRAVEWLDITGYDRWLNSLIENLSTGPQYGIEHNRASWWLFYWCRSDLALRMADPRGLNAWLWALQNGPIERNLPWRMIWQSKERPELIDYLPIAGALLFIWNRISPQDSDSEILKFATTLLSETQMECGGWPITSRQDTPDLIATAFAIHGLYLHRPSGWHSMVNRAADWLEKEQNEFGCWHINGGPTVMLTVLAMDSIQLARQGGPVTFRHQIKYSTRLGSEPLLEQASAQAPTTITPDYDCTRQVWFEPSLPPMASMTFKDAKKIVKPTIAVFVATDTELRQALHSIVPVHRRRTIIKVAYNLETFYIGRLGKKTVVLVLSGMGTEGPTGATLSVESTLRLWKAKIALYVGIAFGASPEKQLPADVLVSEQLIPYEFQRVGANILYRNPVPPASAVLLNRFRTALEWSFKRPNGTMCKVHIGPILSGQKIIDNQELKKQLLTQYPRAVGGEMEGAGLWAAADRYKVEWLVVKGVCDWGDGSKHDHFQSMAAASAFSLCKHVFSDANVFDGI